MAEVDHLLSEAPLTDEERNAFIELSPSGFFIRHPPKPHLLQDFITPDEHLFQTIHMGAAVVDTEKWRLVVDGLVERSFSLDLKTLLELPQKSVTAFHECYGSPLKPPVDNVWRIGNVTWTGVPLRELLKLASPLPAAKFVWSEGLDRGVFAGVDADRYQKDLLLEKARGDEVLLAYQMNGQPLTKERGGPVRLVVPGWFGTNSTKWLSKIRLQDRRATGPYTTTFYNEDDPARPGKRRPVWMIEPNSMIVSPAPDTELKGPNVTIQGRAWSHDGIKTVRVTSDDGQVWTDALVAARREFEWQSFSVTLCLQPGSYTLVAQATSNEGVVQPLQGRRNHCHNVQIRVSNDLIDADW